MIREDPEIKKLSQGKPYVKITNLHYDLSEKDIEELFGKVGEVLFTRIDFDSNGRSLGVGYVGFVDSRNCTVAIDKFDGRKAAGKIISVTNGKPLAERISLAPKRGDKRTSKPKKERARKPTLEELDAELDSYKQGNAANANNDETDEKIEADEPMAQAAFPAVE